MIKFHPSWFIFFMMVTLGFSIVMSSDNWFMTWMGFELSLLGFIPMFSGNNLLMESMVKYFLVQAGGSAMFLFSFLSDSGIIFFLSMCMKLGVFPFFQWVPLVMSSLSWFGCLILSTIQKLSPLFLILSSSNVSAPLCTLLGVSSVISGGILGFNQSNLRLLMGYSSITHSGWVLCSSVFSSKITIMYFLVYCYLSTILFILFDKESLVKVVGGNNSTKSLIWINLLLVSIAGLPPFSMFFLKALILMNLLPYLMVGYLMLLGASLSVFYYLTFIIPSFSGYWNLPISKSGMAGLLGASCLPLALFV